MSTAARNRKGRGRLYIFEGADRARRTALAEAFAAALKQHQVPCHYLPCQSELSPSVQELVAGSSKPGRRRAQGPGPQERQLQEMTHRIGQIESRIAGELARGDSVVVDGFWWSTQVDGRARRVPRHILTQMIKLERTVWDTYTMSLPEAIFLLRRPAEPGRAGSLLSRSGAEMSYDSLVSGDALLYKVYELEDDGNNEEMVQRALRLVPGALLRVLEPGPANSPGAQPEAGEPLDAEQLGFSFTSQRPVRAASGDLSRHLPRLLRPTKVFETYWRFAAERQEIFFKRFEGAPPPWTQDRILQEYRFTNAYRAADRVSQYLIRHVSYQGPQSVEEVFFRTLLFKLFNKIETWKLLESELGEVSYARYDFQRYDEALSQALERGEKIYSAAYVMPTARGFEHPRKHGTHLLLLEHLMKEQVPARLARAGSLREAFEILRSYPMMGDFLAYQYITDLNYSGVYDFHEDFIVPGPGARDGIRKCFEDLGGLTESQVIEHVTAMQEAAFHELGLRFRSLWGRKLHLIDCQNLFCEVDKYARVAHPDVAGLSGRTRIKQHYRHDPERLDYWFPPKWGLNERVEADVESLRHAGKAVADRARAL